MTVQREQLEADVLIVGAGLAGPWEGTTSVVPNESSGRVGL